MGNSCIHGDDLSVKNQRQPVVIVDPCQTEVAASNRQESSPSTPQRRQRVIVDNPLIPLEPMCSHMTSEQCDPVFDGALLQKSVASNEKSLVRASEGQASLGEFVDETVVMTASAPPPTDHSYFTSDGQAELIHLLRGHDDAQDAQLQNAKSSESDTASLVRFHSLPTPVVAKI